MELNVKVSHKNFTIEKIKMSKIKLTDSVTLDPSSLSIFCDMSDLLCNSSAPTDGWVSYTATRECYAVVSTQIDTGVQNCQLDGVQVFSQGDWNGRPRICSFYMKPGQIAKAQGSYSVRIKAYGLK